MAPVNRLPPIHPGEILREEYLAPLGMSANALARELHVPPNRITAILQEKQNERTASFDAAKSALFSSFRVKYKWPE